MESFLKGPGVIIDEIQEVPELFSYLQGIVDREDRPGFFIVTGSQNFILHKKISESLAGRIALRTLLPLTVHEMQKADIVPGDLETVLFQGFYPRIYKQNLDVADWCADYITTYIEKDVRDVLQIGNVVTFQRFLKACATRVGNLVNLADLGNDADISPNTAKAWLSVLEESYIIRQVSPYYKNFSKRLSKGKKLYFNDPALVCWLLGVKSPSDLDMHPMKGALMETFVMSEIFKYCYNFGEKTDIYFWRDVQGHEIDCLIEKSYNKTVPIEIKAGKTVMENFFKGLTDWQDISGQETDEAYVVYGSDQNMKRKKGHVFAWNKVSNMMDEIFRR